jgi:hypothetical protein
MQKTDDMPVWVFLALSSIETRKGAMLLVLINIIFSAYCVPWVMFYGDNEWVQRLFLLTDWEWFAWTIPISLWYWLSIKWVDRHQRWRTEY